MNDQKKILCIEDDAAILLPLRYALEREDWTVVWASSGWHAIELVQQQNFDFIILDVGLPDLNGFEVCKKIRSISHTPLLFLTARDDEIDRIIGLEIGADDYCSKPFSSREIVSRIKAIWRRMELQQQATLQHAQHATQPQVATTTLQINTAPTQPNGLAASQAHASSTHSTQMNTPPIWQLLEDSVQIVYFGTALQLTRYEYRLLKLFIDHPEQVFSRQQLMDHIWEHPEHSLERTVDTHIKSLRQKLKLVEPDRDPIVTHRGFGYRLKRMD